MGTAQGGSAFPGTVSFGTDNTAAFRSMVGLNTTQITTQPAQPYPMNTAAALGRPECLYLPAGNYLTQPLNQYMSAPTPGAYSSLGYGCWIGDLHNHSNLFIIPSTSSTINGDVLSFVNSNSNSSLADYANTQTFSDLRFLGGHVTINDANQGGSGVRDISIIGNRLSVGVQNGIVYYGKTTWAYDDNIIVNFMNGRGFFGGAANSSFYGGFNESVVQNVRLEEDGNVIVSAGNPIMLIPAFEVSAVGSSAPAEGANSDSISNIRIYQPLGPGMMIHNTSSVNAARLFRLNDILIEGGGASFTNLGGDLLMIGEPSGNFGVSLIQGRNIELLNPKLGYAALDIVGSTSSSTYGIDIEGSISGTTTGGNGRGVQIQSCSGCRVLMDGNSSVDYNLVIGTPMAGGVCSGAQIGQFGTAGVIYDGEWGTVTPPSSFTACVTSSSEVSIPQYGSFP